MKYTGHGETMYRSLQHAVVADPPVDSDGYAPAVGAAASSGGRFLQKTGSLLQKFSLGQMT